MLHHEKQVVIETKSTLDKAINDVQSIPDPGNVSNVVILSGLNNLRPDNVPVTYVVHKMQDACRAYNRKFPNATIHMGSVAPANEKCIDYNQQLKAISDERQIPLVSVDPMFDRNANARNLRPNICNLRPNMIKMNDVHYARAGVATLAKEIKRNIYGKHGPSNPRQFDRLNFSHDGPQQSRANAMQNAGPNDPRGAIANFLSMALAHLGNL